MKPLSMDLRGRVVAACDAGGQTQAEIAERFAVSPSTVRRLLARRAAAGSVAPLPHAGGVPSRGDAAAPGGRGGLLGDPPGAAPGRLRGRAGRPGGGGRGRGRGRGRGPRVPGAAGAGPAAKKKSDAAAERDRPDVRAARDGWAADVLARAAELAARLAFVDETGCNTKMAR